MFLQRARLAGHCTVCTASDFKLQLQGVAASLSVLHRHRIRTRVDAQLVLCNV